MAGRSDSKMVQKAAPLSIQERQLTVTRYLRASTRAAEQMALIFDLDGLLEKVATTLVDDFDAVLARVWLYEPETRALRLTAGAGISNQKLDALHAQIDVASYPHPAGEAARTLRPVVQNALAGDSPLPEWARHAGIVSLAAFPLVIGRTLRGVLAFFSRQTLYDEVMEALANFAAIVTAAVSDIDQLERERAAREEPERKEQALRETEERFRIMADSAPVLLWMSDTEGSCTFLNEGWLKFTGRAMEQEMGDGWKESIHPEDLKFVIDTYRQALQTRQGYQIEYRLRRADGGYRWLFSSAAPRFLPDGQFAGFIGSCVDITERKETEEAQLRTQREIESLNARLQRAMTETHHRVKNSLQIVAAMVDMQRMEEDNALRAESLKQLGMHIHTLAVVHDILTEQAKQDGLAHSVSAQAVLERLLPALQNMAGARPIRFSLADAHLSSQQGTSLALVANELVNNALKYGQGAVEVHLSVQDHHALLKVRDHGPGFPPDFDSRQAANTGLELVQNLVRSDLSGQIQFANQPEGGACVTVSFPIKS